VWVVPAPEIINMLVLLQTILNPGDVIYYPREHWHQTRNLDTPTIAITGLPYFISFLYKRYLPIPRQERW
jgi:hypothetical protein